MIDPAVLQQQVEFLEVQLQDSKQRELDLQRMYDNVLLSLDQDSEEVLIMQTKAVEDLKQNQIQVEIEHNDALARLSAQIIAYEKQLRTMKEQLEDSDYRQRTQKLGYEESLMEIRQEALKLKSEKHQLELKLRMQESGEVQSRDQINKSQQMRSETHSKEIERLKEDCEHEVQAVRQQTDAALIELRHIYEKEKKSLEAQLRKAQQATCKMREELDQEQEAKASEAKAGLEKEIAVLKGARQEAEVKAKKYEDELRKALMKLRSKLVPELHGKCPRTPLAKTRLASEPASSGPEEVKRLRCQLTTCRSIIASLEVADKRSKETLLQAQEEVERLQRAIRSKANEDQENKGAISSTKLQERLSSLLIQKDIEIGSLKRQIGEMKGAMHLKSAMKPPAYSPKGHHSRSMSYQRDIGDSSAMYTLGGTPEKQMAKDRYEPDFGSLEEIQVADSMYRVDYIDSRNTPFTQQSTLLREEASSDWSRAFRDLEQKTREQSVAIKELQVERDRASLDAEKLLIQLKHVKLEWAIEAEGYSEREMAFKMQLKQLGGEARPEKTCRVVSRHGRTQSLQNSPR
jgi:hypothetical protein